MLTLEEALARIAELETSNTSLEGEKQALIRKRDELLGKLSKYKKFDAYENLDIEELVRTKDELARFKDETERRELTEKGRLEELYKRDKEQLEKERKAIEEERRQEKAEVEKKNRELEGLRVKTAAIAEFAKGKVRVPEQLFRLESDKLKFDETGEKLIVVDGYKELPVSDWLEELKQKPEYQHHFPPTGASGSGSQPSGSGGVGAQNNPWRKETHNLTEQAKILKSNPQLAERLKAEAGR